MNLEKVTLLIATGGYLGKIPVAPGTFGTLAGLPFVLLAVLLPDAFAAVYVIVLVLFSVWAADRAESALGEKDPGCIVIDEMAGYVVAMSGIALSFGSAATGFILFRIFDIVKPFPARYFERNFKGGAGIVFDDLVAGIFSNFALRFIF